MIRASIVSALFAFVMLTAFACTTDNLELAPNGDSRLREISFKDMNLYPDFDPYVHEYTLFVDGKSTIIGKIVPFMFHTKFTVNGQFVRMATNGYKLPDNTDLTSLFVTNGAVIDLKASDGGTRRYLVKISTPAQDATITGITVSDGVLKSPFVQRSGPFYRESSDTNYQYADQYEVTSSTTGVTLHVEKSLKTATVSATGLGVIDTNATNVVDIAVSGLDIAGTVSNVFVTNTSADGNIKNIVIFKCRYVAPTTDARMLSCKAYNAATSSEVTYLPKFNYDFTNSIYLGGYIITLDNIDTVRFAGILAQKTSTLNFLINGSDMSSLVSVNAVDGSFTVASHTYNMGDKLIFRITQGTSVMNYEYEMQLFTNKEYGFDGTISEVVRDVNKQLEIKSGYNKTVSGIITQLTIYTNNGPSSLDATARKNLLRSGMYIEDGAYGLYVWSYNGWIDGLKIGHKVSIYIKGAKIWMNMIEVTDWEASKTEILDGGKRYPLHYIDGNTMEFGVSRHLGRMMRYSTYDATMKTISSDYDSNGIGSFDGTKSFKLFIPYTKSLSDIISVSEACTFMKGGKQGVFFGPSFTDGDGASMMMMGKGYMIVP